MNTQTTTFSLDEICELVSLPKRTIRYYIQIELLERPDGAGRGAHYTQRHLEQLLEIRKWQDAGLSLERIRELLTSDPSNSPIPPIKPRIKGTLEVKSHLIIDDGIELTIDPTRAQMTPEKVKAFADQVIKLYDQSHTPKD